MRQLLFSIPYLLIGIICVTIIATVGAYSSRALRFNYGYLTIFSFLVYAILGGLISKQTDLGNAFLVNLAVGFYDGTVCWILAKKFRANMGISEEEVQKKTLSSNLAIMLVIAPAFTYLGYSLAI